MKPLPQDSDPSRLLFAAKARDSSGELPTGSTDPVARGLWEAKRPTGLSAIREQTQSQHQPGPQFLLVPKSHWPVPGPLSPVGQGGALAEGGKGCSLPHEASADSTLDSTALSLWSPLLLICIHSLSGHSFGEGGDQASSPEQEETRKQSNYLKSSKKYDL